MDQANLQLFNEFTNKHMEHQLTSIRTAVLENVLPSALDAVTASCHKTFLRPLADDVAASVIPPREQMKYLKVLARSEACLSCVAATAWDTVRERKQLAYHSSLKRYMDLPIPGPLLLDESSLFLDGPAEELADEGTRMGDSFHVSMRTPDYLCDTTFRSPAPAKSSKCCTNDCNLLLCLISLIKTCTVGSGFVQSIIQIPEGSFQSRLMFYPFSCLKSGTRVIDLGDDLGDGLGHATEQSCQGTT